MITEADRGSAQRLTSAEALKWRVGSSLRYIEHPVPADLSRWILCFWEISGCVDKDSLVSHRVLPDGCCDVIVDLGGFCQSGHRALLVGPMSASFCLNLTGFVDVLGARLRPGAMPLLLGLGASELLDGSVDLAIATRVLRFDESLLARVTGSGLRLATWTAQWRECLTATPRVDAAVAVALARWSSQSILESAGSQDHGPASVRAVLRETGISERSFQRRFLRSVGLPAAGYRRLARFRASMKLHASGARDWATVAAELAYSDQSHLVRDFRELAGLSPTEWSSAQCDPGGFFQDGCVTTP